MNKPLLASCGALLYSIGFLGFVYLVDRNVLLTCFYGGFGIGLSGTLIRIFFEDTYNDSVTAARLTLLNVASVAIGIGLTLYIVPVIFH